MPESYLSQYFSGVAIKTLTAVEANPATSNQHEYNGNRDLVRLFGKATSKHRFRARFVYVSAQERITDEAPVTWYDARQNHPTRSEHRLYFPTTKVSRRASAGDLLVIGMLRDNSVLIVIAKEGSPIANDLRRLFGVTVSTYEGFSLWQKEGGLGEEETRSILQTLGVLDRSTKAISSTGGGPAERTAVVVTSLPSDYAAVSGQLRDISEQTDDVGTLFEVGRYDSPVGIWEVAIVQLGIGTFHAGITVDQAVQRFLPEAVIFLGVAHGVREGIAVGDVVVVSAVYTWDFRQLGSRQTETLASSHRVLQRALKEAAGTAWLEKRRPESAGGEPPRVIIAPIASSPKSTINPNAFRASRAVAVDMEDASLLETFDRRSEIEVLVIRGVASVGDTEAINNTQLASDNSAAFAMQVLSNLDVNSVREPSLGPISMPQAEQSYVTGFEIRSIRSIQEIEWRAPLTSRAGWHVLVGINGSGKTTALRCIALALLGKEDAQSLGQKWATWLPEGTPSGEIMVNLSTPGADESVKFIVSKNGPDDIEIITPDHTPNGVFSVGYGPFRRFSGGDADFKERLTPRALCHITLFSEEADLADSLAWLRSLYVKYLEDKAKNTFCFDVEAFINNSDLLPSGTRLVDVSPDQITFEDGNKCIVSIEHLSDGYRSVLSLVLDILRHLSDHQSQVGLFSRERDHVVAEGVVLVDEIDVHLHPKWQQQIGSWFKIHFPKFQFVVASHSLFVCQSADSVFILPDPGSTGSGRMLNESDLKQIKFGTVVDGYGTNVFGPGVDESEKSKEFAHRLASLNLKQLRAGLTADEKAEQTRLRAILPTSDVLPDPAVQG